MDLAVDNYLDLSSILRGDLEAMLAEESNSPHWRRNFVRTCFALLEGYIYATGQIAAIALYEEEHGLNEKELRALDFNSRMKAEDRFKYTLKAAYKRLELQPTPNFGGLQWQKAQDLFAIRDKFMHPKCPSDLAINDDKWSEIWNDMTWLIEQTFAFLETLEAKHVG